MTYIWVGTFIFGSFGEATQTLARFGRSNSKCRLGSFAGQDRCYLRLLLLFSSTSRPQSRCSRLLVAPQISYLLGELKAIYHIGTYSRGPPEIFKELSKLPAGRLGINVFYVRMLLISTRPLPCISSTSISRKSLKKVEPLEPIVSLFVCM